MAPFRQGHQPHGFTDCPCCDWRDMMDIVKIHYFFLEKHLSRVEVGDGGRDTSRAKVVESKFLDGPVGLPSAVEAAENT